MRLPRWDELQGIQLDVYDHPLDQPLFVAGPPGSGKTVLAVQRASMIAKGLGPTKLITYNRMLRRLATLLDTESQYDAATMHTFVHRDFKRRTGAPPPKTTWDPYEHDWPNVLGALQALATTAQDRKYLVIDEGQDLPAGFFQYARGYAATELSVFADEDQTLTRGGTTLAQIQQAAGLPNPILLADNHRNSPEIARFAELFHTGILPAARVLRPATGNYRDSCVSPRCRMWRNSSSDGPKTGAAPLVWWRYKTKPSS